LGWRLSPSSGNRKFRRESVYFRPLPSQSLFNSGRESFVSKFWNPLIQTLSPYVPGEQPKIDRLIKLNTNENPYGPSPKVLEVLKAEAGEHLRRYPDPTSSALKQTIGDHFGLAPDQVF